MCRNHDQCSNYAQSCLQIPFKYQEDFISNKTIVLGTLFTNRYKQV